MAKVVHLELDLKFLLIPLLVQHEQLPILSLQFPDLLLQGLLHLDAHVKLLGLGLLKVLHPLELVFRLGEPLLNFHHLHEFDLLELELLLESLSLFLSRCARLDVLLGLCDHALVLLS